jgi:rhodanese-related sulfurtransferase
MAKEKDMSIGIKQLLEAANTAVPRITPAKAQQMLAAGEAIVVDVRDAPEVEKSGKVPGAIHVSRGMLEFRADPDSPYHDKHFARERPVILYCASGGRSALAAESLQRMGYRNVLSLAGGFKAWQDAGLPVER